MMLNITDQERDYLLELFEVNHKDLLHELHHTDTSKYQELLMQKVALLEKLKAKVENLAESLHQTKAVSQ
ncbi:MAG: hypothetical protein AB1489_41015 [Acidobacteriota bacterium]